MPEITTAHLRDANTTPDGTGGTLERFTNRTDGDIDLDAIRFGTEGTNCATAARIFLKRASGHSWMRREIQLPATSRGQPRRFEEWPCRLRLHPGDGVALTLSVAVGDGWDVYFFASTPPASE